ncbi:oxidoreductase [Streptomyces sp. CS081A]|uniref:oxidoreductase n=1 Tax=Streptomyces sp. CS081A TaxID=2162709 RepID=UPI000D522A9D|nr:oxidoreductase [Streptomyces sp. CS081A]PVC72011.1 oxidoreductase [Streptomyces sp. CS081A]
MTYPTGPYGYGHTPPPPPPKPGVIPLRPLALSEVLTAAFATLGRHWKQLVGVTGVAYGFALLLVGAAFGIGYLFVADNVPRVFDLREGREASPDDLVPVMVAFGCVWLVAVVGMLVATAVVSAAVPVVLQEAVVGGRLTFGTVWGRAWARTPAVLGTLLLTTLVVLVPFLLVLGLFAGLMTLLIANGTGPAVTLLLFPLFFLVLAPLGTWFWVKLAFAPTVTVIERQGPMASLRRSWHLVTGTWWRTFGGLLVAFVLTSVVSMVFQQVLGALAAAPLSFHDGPAPESAGEVLALVGPMLIVMIVGSLIAQVFAALFPPLVSGLLYVDQRIRRENLAPTLARTAAARAYGS